MIRTIFLPEKIGSYYVFAQRIVACEITRSLIKVAVVKIQGNNRIIEKVIDKPIGTDVTLSYQDRVAAALNELISTLNRYDKFIIVLPSNSVVIKELTVPFTNPEKIRLILPFEVESLLPFSLADAQVDCVITSTHDTSSTVLAIAAKNSTLQESIALFEKASIHPTRVTVDMIELFALYKALNPGSKQSVVLLYIGYQTTRLAMVVDGQLKMVRFIPQGITKLAKYFNVETEQFIHAGIDDPTASTDSTEPFFAEMTFTLQSFATKMTSDQKFNKIILMGPGAGIKNLPGLIFQATQIPCEPMHANAVLQKGLAVMSENHGIPDNSILCVSAAMALSTSDNFNLYHEPEEAQREKIFTGQLITSLALIGLIIGSLFVNGFINSRRLNAEIQASEKEASDALKKELPALSMRQSATGLDAIKNTARAEVAREKNIWFALSNQNRASYLRYLQELFTRLDAIGLGLNLSRLTLSEDTLTLEGNVKDYEALKQLEEDLRQSKMFTYVPRLQELKFSAKITLDKNYGEG